MFSSADYSVRAGACVGDWRGIQMWSACTRLFEFKECTADTSMGEIWLFQGAISCLGSIFSQDVGFFCLFVPEGVKVSGTQQATSSHLDKRTGETLMLAICELVRIRKMCCTRQNIRPEIKQACTQDAYLPPRQRNQKKKKKREESLLILASFGGGGADM